MNKMKNILQRSFLLVLSISLISCADDFLDLQPQQNISNEAFLQTFDDFNTAVLGLHDQLQGGGNAALYGRYTLLVPDVMGEDVKQNASANRAKEWAEYNGSETDFIPEDIWREFYEAINIAKNEDLDLIEIAPNARPPVCKVMDIGKFKYDQQKKANKAKKKQKKIELKEIKLRPVTDVHDYSFKIKNAQKFIVKGDKVKFTIKFKGRELQHPQLGHELMKKIQEDMKLIGKVELLPKFDGKQMIMVIQPL